MSPTIEKMLKMPLKAKMSLTMKATTVASHKCKLSTNVYKHSPENCRMFHLYIYIQII